jgi:hypothetical protein
MGIHFTDLSGDGNVKGSACTNGAGEFFFRMRREFDFCYTHRVARGVNDEARVERALRGIVGKRLTYRDSAAAVQV